MQSFSVEDQAESESCPPVAGGVSPDHDGRMKDEPGFQISTVRSAPDVEATVRLLVAYAASLDVDLGYQNFAAEMAAMPGYYKPPAGELLLARSLHGEPLGCVGLRPAAPEGCCEMKRLYVSPQARGLGLGRALMTAIIGAAERIGYSEMRLDTLPTMAPALALYRAAGFTPIAPYYSTPVAGTHFLARRLQPQGSE
jgi:ribosomal protein S18 acetylase RimI-like enzyme